MTDPASNAHRNADNDAVETDVDTEADDLDTGAGADARRGRRAATVVAGVTVAAMLVPQSMAYASLAGLPPQVGLYASTVPLVLYALVGTSRQLAVGPVAIVSLLAASALAPIAAESGTGAQVEAAAVLALLVAAVHLVMGVGRLGFLVRLLSHPVLVGFTAAAAVLIGVSQAKHLLGVSIPRSEHLHDTVPALLRATPGVHSVTVALGLVAVGLLVVLRRVVPRAPGALVVVVSTTAASYGLDLADRGVAVVGDIPGGFPVPGIPGLASDSGNLVVDLLPAAFVITLVGFMESIAVAKVYARRDHVRIDANRELVGLGLANLGAGLFGGYPVTGGFSRTAVNAAAGARSRAAGAVTAVVVAVVLVALTPLLEALPMATLAAIVLVAVTSLVDVAEITRIARVKRSDAATMALAFAATLALGVELGIAVAAAGSLVTIVARMMAPHTAVLGRLPAGNYRNVDRYPEAERIAGAVIVRFDVSLSYLNVDFVRRRIAAIVAGDIAGRRDAGHREPLEAVILDGEGLNDIDCTGAEALEELIEELDRQSVTVHLAHLKGPVRDVLDRTGLTGHIPHRIHDEVADAVAALARGSAQPSLP